MKQIKQKHCPIEENIHKEVSILYEELKNLIYEWADLRDSHATEAEDAWDYDDIPGWKEQRGVSIGYRNCIADLFDTIKGRKEEFIQKYFVDADAKRASEISDPADAELITTAILMSMATGDDFSESLDKAMNYEEREMNCEEYVTGAGQHLHVHKSSNCNGKYCTIHNPVLPWPTLWRSDWGGFMEYICPCGVGYPAPEDKKARDHVFGTCGNAECLKLYREACKKVKEAERQ